MTVFTSGDSFKKIKFDNEDLFNKSTDIIKWGIRLRGTWRINGFKNNLKIRKFKRRNKHNLDLILVINPDFISPGPKIFSGYFTLKDCKKLLKNNGKFFLSSCGVDYAYLTFGNSLKYWPFSGSTVDEIQNYLDKKSIRLFHKLITTVHGIIPVMYESAFVYRELSKTRNIKILPTIPLPIDSQSIQYSPNLVKEKVIIFHGKSRDNFKGSDIISEAMLNIKRKYPEKVELMLPDKLQLEEYLEKMRNANIVIDQCRSYSYAMNALYALSMAKVVFSGNEPECSKEFGFEVPVINILPDVGDIEKKLEMFIMDHELIRNQGQIGRQFVEKYHDSRIIASKYLSLLPVNN